MDDVSTKVGFYIEFKRITFIKLNIIGFHANFTLEW